MQVPNLSAILCDVLMPVKWVENMRAYLKLLNEKTKRALAWEGRGFVM